MDTPRNEKPGRQGGGRPDTGTRAATAADKRRERAEGRRLRPQRGRETTPTPWNRRRDPDRGTTRMRGLPPKQTEVRRRERGTGPGGGTGGDGTQDQGVGRSQGQEGRKGGHEGRPGEAGRPRNPEGRVDGNGGADAAGTTATAGRGSGAEGATGTNAVGARERNPEGAPTRTEDGADDATTTTPGRLRWGEVEFQQSMAAKGPGARRAKTKRTRDERKEAGWTG